MYAIRRISALAVVTTLATLAACGDDSITTPSQDDAARVVSLFTQLADSVSRSGGDTAIGSAYASLAESVRMGGRVSTILITLDGVPTKFSATAMQTEINPCPAGTGCGIATPAPLRSLVAWQQDDPRRVIQLSSRTDAEPIRAYLYPTLVPYAGPSAMLTFYDGKGGTFFGTSGTQKLEIRTSETLCTSAGPDRPIIAIFPAPPRCTQADFMASFDGKAEPSSFLAPRNTATGSHTFAMASQPVPGARYELNGLSLPRPPFDLPPTISLPASLSATVDSVVTLTLTVSNPTSSPLQVVHSSGQQFDFTVTDASTGAALWRWSADKGFFQAFITDTIAANGKVTYTVTWRPSRKGTFIATGDLVSVSANASARGSFTVN